MKSNKEILWLSPSFYASGCQYGYKNIRSTPSAPAMVGNSIHEMISTHHIDEENDQEKLYHDQYEKDQQNYLSLLGDKELFVSKKDWRKHFSNYKNSSVGKYLDNYPEDLLFVDGEVDSGDEVWKQIRQRDDKYFAHVLLTDDIGLRFAPDICFSWNDTFSIIDIKTGFNEAEEKQLEAYAVGCQPLFPEYYLNDHDKIKVAFLYTGKKGMLDLKNYTVGRVNKIKEELISFGETVRSKGDAGLPRTKNKYCCYCPEFTVCSAVRKSEIEVLKETETPTVLNVFKPEKTETRIDLLKKDIKTDDDFTQVKKEVDSLKNQVKVLTSVQKQAEKNMKAYLKTGDVIGHENTFSLKEVVRKWNYEFGNTVLHLQKNNIEPFAAVTLAKELPAKIIKIVWSELLKEYSPSDFFSFKKENLEDLIRKESLPFETQKIIDGLKPFMTAGSCYESIGVKKTISIKNESDQGEVGEIILPAPIKVNLKNFKREKKVFEAKFGKKAYNETVKMVFGSKLKMSDLNQEQVNLLTSALEKQIVLSLRNDGDQEEKNNVEKYINPITGEEVE